LVSQGTSKGHSDVGTVISLILNVGLTVASLFLICLVLIQRGKGGGLAGAFGGTGGSSAFGTKAGDVFTKVTIYVAIVWGALAMALVWSSNRGTASAWGTDASTSVSKSIDKKAGTTGKGTTGKDKTESPDPGLPGPMPSRSPAAESSAAPAG